MEFQYLGTAAAEAFPALFCHCEACNEARFRGGKNIRGRAGAVIDKKLLIDFPPDIYFQTLKFNIDLGNIGHVIVTHTHLDHFAVNELVMRDTGCYAKLPENCGPLNIYGSKNVLYELYFMLNKEFGCIKMTSFNFIELKPFDEYVLDDYKIIPLAANHSDKEFCMIYLIEKNGKRILYGNDTGYFPQQTFDFLKDKKLDLISLDCCYSTNKGSFSHMGFQENIEVKNHLNKLNCLKKSSKLILTHFSHNCGLLHEQLEAEADKTGFYVAYDGMKITV